MLKMNLLLVMLISISFVSGQLVMNVTTDDEIPIVVLEGQDFEISLKTNFDLHTASRTNKIVPPSSLTDIFLMPGNTSWFSFDTFTGQDPKDTRPEAWKIQWWQGNVNDPNKAIGIRVRHATKKDNGNWSLKAFKSNSEFFDFPFKLIVAEIPSDISFVESKFQEENVVFKKIGEEAIPEELVTCKVTHVRPAPTFQWMIGSNLAYLDDFAYNDFNASISATSEIANEDDPNYLDVTQTLTLRPKSWMDGRYLRCRTNHTAYNSTHQEEDKSYSINMIVQAPPVPNNTVIETVSDGELVTGQEGMILIPFHSNPHPTNITWYLTDIDWPLSGNQTIGKYTSEGWIQYNKTTARASTSTATGFVARLRIDKLRSSDSGMEHSLTVANELGQSNYTFRIQEITNVGLGGGEIAGIVIGCILAVILIAALVILFIRRKNIKKSKKIKQERRKEREEGRG